MASDASGLKRNLAQRETMGSARARGVYGG